MTYGFRHPPLPEIACVEREADSNCPGRTAYHICGLTAKCVQSAIDTISSTVDTSCGGVPGMAKFTPIVRVPGGFGALGVVTIDQSEFTT